MKRICNYFVCVLLLFGIPNCDFYSQHTVAAEDYGNATAKYVSVYDGDTIFVNICNWPEIIGKRIGIRINGIDTPERNAKNPKIKILAAEARMFVVQTLNDADKIELRNMNRGKYFRIVADVFVNGQNLSDMLVDKKLAKRYDGKEKRPKWSVEDYNNYFGEYNDD